MNRFLIAALIAVAGNSAIAAGNGGTPNQDDCIKLGITVSQIARIMRDNNDPDDRADFMAGVNSSKDKAAKSLTLALIREIKKSDKSAVELSSNAISNCLKGK